MAAMERNQFGPAVQAVMGIGKMMGHLADKTEIELHILSKPSREPTTEISLTPDQWQEMFAPKRVDYDAAGASSPNGSSKVNSLNGH
jgi:hypothetical protein